MTMTVMMNATDLGRGGVQLVGGATKDSAYILLSRVPELGATWALRPGVSISGSSALLGGRLRLGYDAYFEGDKFAPPTRTEAQTDAQRLAEVFGASDESDYRRCAMMLGIIAPSEQLGEIDFRTLTGQMLALMEQRFSLRIDDRAAVVGAISDYYSMIVGAWREDSCRRVAGPPADPPPSPLPSQPANLPDNVIAFPTRPPR